MILLHVAVFRRRAAAVRLTSSELPHLFVLQSFHPLLFSLGLFLPRSHTNEKTFAFISSHNIFYSLEEKKRSGNFALFFPISYIRLRNSVNPVFRNGTRLFQEVEAPRFQDNRHMMVVSSDLRTGCLYPQEIFLAFISFKG
jgi:hypothetical protein